jgi:hypothetical protein
MMRFIVIMKSIFKEFNARENKTKKCGIHSGV